MGGSSVEVESAGARLLLDAGLPLASVPDSSARPVSAKWLEADRSLAGVVVTHGHLDHFGLVEGLPEDVPLYMGRGAHAIISAAGFFSKPAFRRPLAGCLEDRCPFKVGPFLITPYLVDHSGFDAYALLVEADGRRLFYSGDLRAHGRKSAAWRRLLSDPPVAVDAFLMEGTTVGRSTTRAPLDEAGVEEDLRRLFRSAAGAAIVFASAQNIDRLVSVHRAAKRADRTLVMDLYAATIATASGNVNIPQPGLGFDLRVYVPNRQRVLVKESGEFARVDELGRERIFPTEMAARRGELVILTQASTLPELAKAGVLAEAAAVWSLWPGYLDRDRRVAPLLDQNGVPLSIVHASGHAGVDDLQLLATAIGATRVVPIHTSARERYADLFPGVELHDDGEWWDV